MSAKTHRWELQPNGRWSIGVHVYEEFILVDGKAQVVGYVVATAPEPSRFATLDEAIPVARALSDLVGWQSF